MAKQIERKISIYINGKEVANNLNAVGKEIGKLKGQLRHLAPGTEEFIKKSAELKKAQKHYKDINDEIRGTDEALREAQASGTKLLAGLASGNFTLIQDGLRGIVGNVKNLTAASLKFIATPVGAFIAVLAGIGVAAKQWFDFNIQVEKARQEIRDLTNESGLLVDVIRVRSDVLTKTFEADQKKVITTAKSLVQNLGISYNEAFDIIEDGAIRGKLKNDEYLESLAEYPSQFKNAGFTAKEFANIVETGIDLAIYKDKLPDAIKEADLAMREQTKSTRDALANAFGAAFTDDLLRKVRKGELTTKEALSQIAAKSKEVNLNQQQQAQLTADLFKGAGEDAGGALKIFDALNISLNEQKKPLTEIQQLQQEQLNANKELNSLYTQIFATSDGGFGKIIAKAKLFVTQGLLKMLQYGVDVYNWFVDLNNESGTFSALLTLASKTATIGFKVIGDLVKNAIEAFKGLGTIVEGVFTLDPAKIAAGFKQSFNALPNLIKDVKNTIKEDVADIYDAFTGKGTKLEKFNILDYNTVNTNSENDTTSGFTTGTTDSPTTSKDKKDKKEELTDEDKRIINSKKKLAEFLKAWEEEQQLQAELKKFEDDLKKEEEDVLRMEKELQKMAEEAGYKTIMEAGLEEVRLQKLQEIRDKYAKERLDKSIKENEKLVALDEETKSRLIRAEENLEAVKRNALQNGLNAFMMFNDRKSIISKIAFGFQQALAVKEVLLNSKRAIAEATANLATANLKAIATSPLTAGNPWVAINSGIYAKEVAATKISTATSIAGILAQTFSGRFYGGPTSNKTIAPDAFGGISGFHHPNEYVIPAIQAQNPIYQPIIQRLENDRRQINGLPIETSSTSTDNNLLVVNALERLMLKLEEPLIANALIGDDEITRHTQRDTKLKQARINARVKLS